MTHRRFTTMEEALDYAAEQLAQRFGEVDQQAAVALAQAVYTMQEREEFLQREDKATEVPYRS